MTEDFREAFLESAKGFPLLDDIAKESFFERFTPTLHGSEKIYLNALAAQYYSERLAYDIAPQTSLDMNITDIDMSVRLIRELQRQEIVTLKDIVAKPITSYVFRNNPSLCESEFISVLETYGIRPKKIDL